ncbi:hypothetical protein B0H14DRAFT_3171834 [Mycena olivaceomarginata]|nr:hypothetical protein B0H14DRAFT_3171834 [Mycena olivaceomarginata]
MDVTSRLDAARHGLRLGASEASRNAAVYQWAERSEMELERIANAPLLILSQTAHHSIPASSSPWPSTPTSGRVLTRSGYVRLDGKIVSSHQARDPSRSNARFSRPADFDILRSWMAQPRPTSAAELQLTFGIHCQNFLQHYASLKRMCLPSIVGRFSAFNVCTTMAKFNARDMATIVERIFASVTATQLQRLVMGCCGYPELALQWPHAEFVSLCKRSNLSSCLRTLRIVESETLQRSRANANSGGKSGKSNGVITDSFLRAISDAPGRDCLVPCLSYFACVSRLTFTHGLLADLATSRVARLSGSSMPFHLCIRRFPGTDIVVTSAVRTALWDLAADNAKFTYDAGEIEKYKRPSRSRKSGGSKGERPFTDGSKLLETCITREGSGLNSFWSAY